MRAEVQIWEFVRLEGDFLENRADGVGVYQQNRLTFHFESLTGYPAKVDKRLAEVAQITVLFPFAGDPFVTLL